MAGLHTEHTNVTRSLFLFSNIHFVVAFIPKPITSLSHFLGGFFAAPPASLLPLLVVQKLAVLQVAQPTMEIQSLSARRLRGAGGVSSSLSKRFWSFRAKRVRESLEK